MPSLFVVYLAAAAVLQNADAARILGLFPHTGKSHQIVYDPLLRRLAERGHHVTVVSFFPIKNPPANYTDISLEGLAYPRVETVDLSVFENPVQILRQLGLELSGVMQLVGINFLADLALEVCSKLVKFQPLADALKKEYDVILVENFNSDCMLGLAHVYGVNAPVIGLSSSSLMQWCPDRIGVSYNPSYVPMETSDYTAKMTFSQRIENTLLNEYYKLWYRHFIQVKEQAILEKQFERKIPDLQDLGKNITMMLVNVFHSLNGVRPLLPGLVEVGGMHLDHTRKTVPPNFQRFLNESDHGVILLSFGSLIKTASIPKYKEQIIVRALSKLKQRVIWKFEDSPDEGKLEGNILKVRWIPQYELLQHPKVIAFMGHGGLSGMTEAISAGKPMLVVPFFGDQPLNGAQATEIGFGKTISYADLTENSLYEALQSVLSVEMRESARRASEIWQDRQNNPLDTAVFWTERVIRWGHTDPLHSRARDTPFYQRALLDVIATVLVILLILITILITILKVLFEQAIALFRRGSVREKNKLN